MMFNIIMTIFVLAAIVDLWLEYSKSELADKIRYSIFKDTMDIYFKLKP